jgi:hypothetical protein
LPLVLVLIVFMSVFASLAAQVYFKGKTYRVIGM